MWGNRLKSRNLVIIELYLRLPMYAIIAFSGIIAGGIFSASAQILHFPHVAYVCRFWNGEKTRRNGEKNQEPKMWKLKRRKQLETANI